MIQTIRKAWGIPELRKKIIFTLLILLIFRIGNAITVPYVDVGLLETYLDQMGGTILGLYNVMSGGAFAQATVFALSIQPYINASIIIQLLTVAIPALERLAKDGGEEGRKKIQSITRYTTVGIAILQAVGYYFMMRNYNLLASDATGIWPALVIVVSFIAGSSFVMWMGEQVTEFGVGNGISIILFASIISRIPSTVSTAITNIAGGAESIFGVLLILVLALALVVVIVFVNDSERRIPIQYAKQMRGRKMYGGSSTYLPLKINMSGVIPPIFASSILAIPTLIAQFGKSDQSWVKWINSNLANTTSVWYIALYALMIVFFCFFYTEITFNPDETADNMKQYGGFIPGIRAGNATSRYLTYVMNRLNTVGAVYLLFVALIPTVLIMALGLNAKLPFGGTTILIIAGVGLDTLRQAKAQTEQFQYAGFLFEGTDHKEGK